MLHLLKGSREELAKYIKEQNKKIVVYGAGMIFSSIFSMHFQIWMYALPAAIIFYQLAHDTAPSVLF